MNFKLTPQLKVGLFVLIVLVVLAYVTVRISQTSLIPGGTYLVYLQIDSATGITNKTPVEIAGIRVGFVSAIDLIDNNQARLTLEIKKSIKLSKNVEARIKSVGMLGDTYIELYQPGEIGETLPKKATIQSVTTYGDFSSVTNELSAVARDGKAVTATMKHLMAGDDSSFARSLKNIEAITDAIKNVSTGNERNLNAIIANMRSISENLNMVVASNVSNMNATLENVSVITGKVRDGEGTIGRLINDDETVEKLNSSIDNLNELLGGANKLQVDVGYHTEYLGTTEEFKHYVSLALKPKPDKFFLLEFVDDPAPDSKFKTKRTAITSGGTTTNVTEEIETVDEDRFLFSAQLAKKYYGFTFRGGLIESSGGVGVDYEHGPIGVKLSAFDFETKRGERPHLKAMGTFNVTRSIYLLGGMDDFISKDQDPDWFFGAGVQISDDDIKSLMGLLSVKP